MSSQKEFCLGQHDERPKIICFHGAGTNGSIFRLQARAVIRLLEQKFRFIFVDAPFESLPGPGVLPVYADMQPYLWWHCDEDSIGRFQITSEEVQKRRQAVREMLISHLADPDIVGIMAFSQGARVATGLCLDEELSKRIKFAVLFASTFPALLIGDAAPPPSGEPHSNRDADEGYTSKVMIPSVHVQGTMDPWAAEGTRLMDTYFMEKGRSLIRFRGGHACPVANNDAQRVAKAVFAAWNSIEINRHLY